jgi:hypothetical protein
MYLFFFRRSRQIFLVFGIFCCYFQAFSQLDSIHWVPPMHARGEWGPQYLYLTTPETTPFSVSIQTTDGTVLSVLVISNSSPKRYDIGNSNNTLTLVGESELHQPLNNKGFVLVAEKKFYVNFRAHSESQYQACDLTCKGRAALGLTFRMGQMIQGASQGNGRSNFIGMIATEDSTKVSLSEYDSGVRFRVNGADVQIPGAADFTLMAGQSLVISQYLGSNATFQPPNGMIGSLLTANKPIAVNVGSWTGAPVNESANDIGVDQIVPIELVGEEYILCKGNGGNIIEIPYVVAHENGTQVFLNGNSVPSATLNASDYFQIPTSQFTSAGNLHILTSKPSYVYQVVGGVAGTDDEKRTGGLIFVPPISCAIPNAVDNIYQPNQIGTVKYDGGLMIVAMRDSLVTVRLDGVITSIGTPSAVQGNPDFVTYRNLTLFSSNNPPNTVSIIAEGAVQVAYFGRNGAAGFGGFFSGFSKVAKPNIALNIIGDGVCPDTLVASGRFDGVQWYFKDSLLQYGADSFFIAYSPGKYTARGYLGVCRRTDFAEDTLTASFNSPKFPYQTTLPSCFGLADASVDFGQPSGGLEPYQYSVNGGKNYTYKSSIVNLKSGDYTLVVKDSTGCYNYPIDISIGQPDSLGVTAEIIRIDEPLEPGESVLLGSTPSRPIELTEWLPDEIMCGNCTQITVKPQETTWFTVTVTDSEGCTATDRVQLVIQPNIFAPNIIYPADNEGNDRFILFSKDPVPINWLRIYDRWGNLVFETKNAMTNERSSGWDGTVRNKDANPGVFIFVAEIEHVPGRKFTVKGDITVVR